MNLQYSTLTDRITTLTHLNSKDVIQFAYYVHVIKFINN